MRRHNLLRSTPFRLALAFAVFFICAFLLAGVVTIDLIKRELDARYDNRTQELFHVISQSFSDSDIQDVIEATRVHIAATANKRDIFLLQTADGRVLAANIPATHVADGWSKRPGTDFGIPGDYAYRLFSGPVGSNRLVVGTNNEETDDLREIVFVSFGWASIVVIALAIGGGALIASRAQRRLDAVRDTMSRVSHGELAARIPLLGRGDDIDLMSADINVALERLAAAVESMRQVSSDIAHDLKTPLNHLKITLEEAKLKEEASGPVAGMLEAALAEADQINQTFEALLRIAQIEAGARKSRFTAVNLFEILVALADVYRSVAEDAGLTLKCELTPEAECIVLGDRELLTQMYANLIENAIRHCPPGAVIHVSILASGDKIITSVEDDGPGIPEEEHEKVFRRLYRLEKSRTSPGSGLGLSLVKAVADLHAAEIHFEDAGPGLRVIITFARLSGSSNSAA
ncbi:MAG: HAMP domain-containing protein [Rhodopseudomonas sp.]|nr:HAMP domain-containing protein [Rhodopseudomonas sp.]